MLSNLISIVKFLVSITVMIVLMPIMLSAILIKRGKFLFALSCLFFGPYYFVFAIIGAYLTTWYISLAISIVVLFSFSIYTYNKNLKMLQQGKIDFTISDKHMNIVESFTDIMIDGWAINPIRIYKLASSIVDCVI